MEPKRADESEQVRIRKPLARRARIIASALGMTLPEYIEARLVPVVDRELPDVLDQIQREGAERNGKREGTEGNGAGRKKKGPP
jgi:hypothetical protein